MSHKQIIVVRKDLNMRKGKMCAQASHASLAAILNLCKRDGNTLTLEMDDRTKPWITGLFKKVCVSVDSEQEMRDLHQEAIDAGLITSIIIDSGLTEFNGVPTLTAIAIGPDYEEKVNSITGHLKLL